MAAAVRGEEVVLDSATGARVRLVGEPVDDKEIERRAAKRRAASGDQMYKHLIGDRDIDVPHLKMDDFWDERDRRKFGDIG